MNRASRVMKARTASICPLCLGPVNVGQQIGRTPIGWCHTACIINAAHAIAPKENPA